MTNIDHEIKIHAPAPRIYEALTTLAELRKWHTAATEGDAGTGGVLTMQPANGPLFEWKVTRVDPDGLVEWSCVKGPGRAAGTRVRFVISPTDGGRTLVEFVHADWPDAGGNFRKCNTLWAILLFNLRKYMETRQADPAF